MHRPQCTERMTVGRRSCNEQCDPCLVVLAAWAGGLEPDSYSTFTNPRGRSMIFSARTLLSGAAAIALAIGAAFVANAQTSDSSPDSSNMTQIGKEVPEAAFSGARSRDILIAQVLVDRSRHSPGVIDGYDGGNTRRALKAFESANGLTADGKVDDELMRKLSANLGDGILRSYTITSEDVSGPFKPVPGSMKAMAKRDALGFASAEELLSEKFHMTPGLLKALNPGARLAKAGTTILVIDGGDEEAAGSVARIEVDKANSELRAYDGSDKLIATYPATVGSGDFPSPSGSMKVAAIAAAPNYTFDPEEQKWGGDKTLILPPGPNNPVGGTWIDLGKNGYGIHGTPDPADIGKTASHGCVRLTNWDAAELAKAVQPGTTQVVFK